MTQLMPVLFIGHGSPMNALENNRFTDKWTEVANSFTAPKAILAISAHWYIDELAITANSQNQTIHDFYGFPPALHNFNYPSKGSAELAANVNKLLDKTGYRVHQRNDWGLDHGVWSILTHMYPKADIPVVQLSIKRNQKPEWHYQLGQQLQPLREEGVLILASGNIVHNLGLLNWHKPDNGFPWAEEFDTQIASLLNVRDYANICNYQTLNNHQLAIPTDEHFLPLLYAVGAGSNAKEVRLFNQEPIYGSLSMTSVMFNN